MNTLIVGVGTIGSKIYDEYKAIKPDRYDPGKGYFEKKNIKYDVAFIAVDTPMNRDGSCNLEQVEKAVSETNAEVYVLRSTVIPGTTDRLREETGKRIIFAPEFYGTTHHADPIAFDFSFMILGGDKKDSNIVVQLLQDVYDSRYRFCLTDAKTAELVKYMANTFLAARVSLCVQFWEIAKEIGVSYPELRQLWLQDSRFAKANTFVYDEHPYWESHCFDKDLPAVTQFANAPLIQAVVDYNSDCKERYKKQ